MTDDGGRARESRRETAMNQTRIRRVAGVLGTLLLVAIVVPFVVFAVPQLVGADHAFVVLSGSMEPSIAPGDVVVVAGGPVAVGDVITFRRGGDVPTTHRVVEVVDGAYRTKGDANENVDAGLVQPEQVLGRVAFVLPFVGHVVLWANTQTGFLLLVALPLAALVALELWELRPGTGDPSSADSSADDASNTAGAEPPATVAVAPLDLTLTFWTLLAFAAYAGWVVVDGWQRVATLSPLAVAVFTGAFVALLLVTVLAVRARVLARKLAAANADDRTDQPGAAASEGGD
ncbi:signal peptidase I [Halorarius halobius]|uniref:signal peptidase I n=1 Tax=Halorarius halobius TaxID=2962671 RepID=UPI0020CE4022|nr:signal peptidase I [Halorarius halobius]